MKPVSIVAACFMALAFGLAPAARAVSVRALPSPTDVVEGSVFQIELVADLDVPVLIWGLDFGPLAGVFGGPEFEVAAPPVLGPAWLPVAASDGDGLAGAAFPDGVMGDDVLLATLSLRALSTGTGFLSPTLTPGDPNEGFALDPSGFAVDPLFTAAQVIVRPIPEPSTALLLGGALLALARRRRAIR